MIIIILTNDTRSLSPARLQPQFHAKLPFLTLTVFLCVFNGCSLLSEERMTKSKEKH